MWLWLGVSAIVGLSPLCSVAADAAARPLASQERIAQLINQLGDSDYFVRERAEEELGQMGVEAFDALNDAENRDDVEIADRARYLIRLMRVQWVSDNDPTEVKRLLENYESLEEKERLGTIEQLASLPDNKGLTALCRLVRFEKSPLLAKRAALNVVQQKLVDESQWKERAAAILEGLGRSPRCRLNGWRLYHDAQ